MLKGDSLSYSLQFADVGALVQFELNYVLFHFRISDWRSELTPAFLYSMRLLNSTVGQQVTHAEKSNNHQRI